MITAGSVSTMKPRKPASWWTDPFILNRTNQESASFQKKKGICTRTKRNQIQDQKSFHLKSMEPPTNIFTVLPIPVMQNTMMKTQEPNKHEAQKSRTWNSQKWDVHPKILRKQKPRTLWITKQLTPKSLTHEHKLHPISKINPSTKRKNRNFSSNQLKTRTPQHNYPNQSIKYNLYTILTRKKWWLNKKGSQHTCLNPRTLVKSTDSSRFLINKKRR